MVKQLTIWLAAIVAVAGVETKVGLAMSAHDFSFTSIEGDPLPMSSFAGKAVLMVNTASYCGYTRQYTGLQSLWETYRDRGLVVLGVPSNDFGGQEPEGEAEIKNFCESRYAVDFPLTSKQTVVGSDAHPLYQWIAGEMDDVPGWNFHKYLIAADGSIAGVWSTRVPPDNKDLVEAIEAALPE